MAYPKWFNEAEYLNNKLGHLQKIGAKDANGSEFTSISQVADALKAAGTDPYTHYNAYGSAEGLSPSVAFNAQEYCEFKLRSLQNDPASKSEWTGRSWQDVQYEFGKIGMSLGQHYAQYGAVEGVSMSNAFDTNVYLAAKLDLLKAADKTWEGKTVKELATAFKDLGLDPYTHYMTYKGTGANEVPTALDVSSKDPVQGGGSGKTFRLTTGVDTAVGNFIDGSRAVLEGQIVDTLNNADTITGTASSSDTLFVQFTENTTTTPASIKNVEVISVEAMGAGGATLSLINADASVTTIKTANSAGAVTVSDIQSVPTAYEVSTTAANFTANVSADKMAGTSDAATLKLTNVIGAAGAAVTVSIGTATTSSGYETLSISSEGSVARNNVALRTGSATGLATLNVNGNTDLTLSLHAAAPTFGVTSVNKVDASAMNANLTLIVDATNTQNMTITGGKGDDTFDMAGTYTTGDTIDGGEGTSNRLILATAEATVTTAQSNVKGIDVIQVGGGVGALTGLTGTIGLANFGATGLALGIDMTGNSVVNYAAGTNSLDFQNFDDNAANHTLAVNVAGSATDDVLNITAGSSTAGVTFGNGGIVINGAETVNLVSQGTANTFGGVFTLTDTAATQSLVITGNQNVVFTGAVTADKINASGLTGSATLTLTAGTAHATDITGTGNNDSLMGSTGADIIHGGAGDDTITNRAAGNATAGDELYGDAGNDTFVLYGDVAVGAGTLSALYRNASHINDFNVGASATTTDILSLSATFGNYTGASAFYGGVAVGGAGTANIAIQSVMQNGTAQGIQANTDMIKLTTGIATTGLTLQQAFNTAIGTATVTTLTAGDDIFFSLYDTTNGRMLIGVVDATNTTNTVIETGDTVTLVGSIDMTADAYANFNANNFAIVA